MQLKTILNRVQKFKRFVYGDVRWEEDRKGEVLVIEMWPRRNGRPICSGCNRPGPGYDTLQPRLFEFVPLWGIAVFFLYVMRRVDCKRCGVKVEAIPWADGKQTLTRAYMHFLASWAKRMSWKEVAEIFHTSWEKVYRSVEWIVEWGLAHRDLSGIMAIGIDELLWRKGHQ
jgi:transposase